MTHAKDFVGYAVLALYAVLCIAGSVNYFRQGPSAAHWKSTAQHWFERAMFAEKSNAQHQRRIAAERRETDRTFAAIEPELKRIDAQRLADRQRREYRAVHGSSVAFTISADRDELIADAIISLCRKS